MVDDELTELAAVIAEHTLDNNAANWFKIPWRDGWNAIELALEAVKVEGATGWLRDVCHRRSTAPEVYWAAQEMLDPYTTPNHMLRAAFRCLQTLISNSSGGGEAYNAILVGPFASEEPSHVADLVLEYRGRDSIGTSPTLNGDGNDRLRRAFVTAWTRGLFHAAYALPQATLNKLTVIK